MRKSLLSLTLLPAALLCGCSGETGLAWNSGGSPPAATTAADAAADAAPVPPDPAADTWPEAPADPNGVCPYLDTDWVADANGERVTGIGLDTRFDPPGCVYWSYQDDPQLRVLVRHLPDRESAIAVVDAAAPVDYTSRAEEPAGWSGGRSGGNTIPGNPNAVYAVAKDTTAVVVFTHQEQSFKAQLVAEQVIANLGL